jgi:hypothetical protein
VTHLLDVVARLRTLLNDKPLHSGRRNSEILRSLYRLLDLPDARLLCRVLRIVLIVRGCGGCEDETRHSQPRVRVPIPQITKKGETLAAACRMLYKLTREAVNDSALLEEQCPQMLLSVLATATFPTNADALVYCCGAAKNMTNDGRCGCRDQIPTNS